MNPKADSMILQSMVDQATPEQRRSLLTSLLRREIADANQRWQPIEGESGRPLGVFVPVSTYRDSLPMSEESLERLASDVRTTRESDLMTHEQLLQELGLEDSRRSSKR